MSKLYANPFIWGQPVKGTDYLQRGDDQTRILALLEKQGTILLAGRRGTGKTSLVRNLLEKHPLPSVHLDLRFVVSRQEVFELLLKALSSSFPRVEIETKLKQLSADDQMADLDSILDLWVDMVKGSKKQFIMVWDEVQHLAKFKEDILDELKTSLKSRPAIIPLFISHRRDTLVEVFGEGRQASFQNQTLYELGNLEEKECVRYLSQRFRRMGLSDFDLPSSIYSYTQGQPFLTQRLAYTVAQLWLEGTTSRLLQRSIEKLLRERNVFFTAVWDHFGLNEKRLLIGLASDFHHPTELGFIARFGLSATSTAHNTVLKLLREGWLINRDEGYHIYDPLFLNWLQQRDGLL